MQVGKALLFLQPLPHKNTTNSHYPDADKWRPPENMRFVDGNF